MADIKYVVVLVMENRSFDEYFGTFPGANGVASAGPAIPQPWPKQVAGVVYPFRGSTFTTNAMSGVGLGHDWNSMHIAAGLDSVDGSASVSDVATNTGFQYTNDLTQQTIPAGSTTAQAVGQSCASMCYYAQDDIPYHWALARTFALCDSYFCSALAGTGTNRLFITGGTIDPFPPPPSGIVNFSTQTSQWIQNQIPVGGTIPPVDQQAPIIGNMFGTTGYTYAGPSDPTANTPQVVWTQLPWGSYLSDLRASPQWAANGPLYAVYDDWNWAPPWANGAFGLYYGSYACNDLNTFACYNDNLGVRGDAQYKETTSSSQYQPDALLQFEIDMATAAPPPTVTWLFPPYSLSEHPPFTSADGAYYLSRIVDAVISSPHWLNTVLVITYDETNTHFDHVPPPISPDPRKDAAAFMEPWVTDNGGTNDVPYPVAAPIGAGMRVPTIIVSPWTYGVGVIHEAMDHTSVLRLLESVTSVTAKNLPAKSTPLGWRRNTFGNLFDVINGLNTEPVTADLIDRSPATGLPKQETALLWQKNGWNRMNAVGPPPNPSNASPGVFFHNPNGPTPPPTPVWPPVAQACELILPAASFTRDQVMAASVSGGAYVIPQALQVIVQGFEPAEYTTSDALGPVSDGVLVKGSNTPCSTRLPTVTFTQDNGAPVLGVTAINATIDYLPAYEPGDANAVPGVPILRTFTFDLSVEAGVAANLFPRPPPPQGSATPNVISIEAQFTVDTTVASWAELELLSTDDPQFYHDFTNGVDYLSGELRVFSVAAGASLFGVTLKNTGDQQSDALDFITRLLTKMNPTRREAGGPPSLPATQFPPGSGIMVSSFDDLNALEDTDPLTLAAAPAGQTGTLNFALARVKMLATQPASNVRVFFRSARASVTTAAYDAGTDNGHPAFYRSAPPTPVGSPHDDTKVPLLGVLPVTQTDGSTRNEYVTIPFFASPRLVLDANTPHVTMQDQAADAPNVAQTIPAATSGTPVETYFGCWLDINQTAAPNASQTQALFPQYAPSNPAQWDGPWGPAGLGTIQQAFLRDMHQCLVAEIAFDSITIPPGDTPSVSAWLAQRNLGLTQ
jgi:phospholipase C